ncbi:hypothetical protein LINPERHAP2_LOCUS27102 [Linum perenne]
MDDGLWMRNCNGDGDGDGDGFNGYRRMEPKRSHEWVDDGGCDLDFYPYKRQAVEPPSFVMPGYGYPNPGIGGHGLIGSRNMENMHSSESSRPEGPVLPEVELIHQISSMAAEIDTLKANMAAMQVGSQSRVSTEFLNPDEHLCSIKQMGTVQEYRKEFGRRSGRVKHWPEHCLLGVFLNGLKEELKIDVRIRKPVSIDMATSLAMECEANNKQHLASRSSLSAMSANIECSCSKHDRQQICRGKGSCFRCGYRFTTGHRCKNKDSQTKQ